MAFVVKVSWTIVSLISQLLQGKPNGIMGFEQVIDNITFKRMDVLRKKIQSLLDYVLKYFLDTCNLKQILTLIITIKSFMKSYLVCSDINERYDIR